MRAGPLNQRIALQRKTTSYSSSGTPFESWTTLVERWSGVDPVTGDERNASQQWIAREQTKFSVRWSPEINDLSPLDRIIYPASAAGNSPASPRSLYDIIAVHEEGLREQMIILAARRVA
jgi:head-tail adaptor